MREYYFDVTLKFSCAIDSENEYLAKEKLKASFKDDFNLDIIDAEIVANGYEEKDVPAYDSYL